MPKARGDVQKNKPVTLGEVTQDLARTLDKRDPRFERFWNYEPIPKMYAPQAPGDTGLLMSDKRIQAVFGANRSTKTTFCDFITIAIYTGIIPPALQGHWFFEDIVRNLTSGPGKRPRYARIVVMDYSEHWPVVIEPLLVDDEFGMLPTAWASDFSKSDHIFRGPDGSILDIWSSDPAEQKEHSERAIRGGRIDVTWIDEINKESVLTESAVRPAAHEDSPKLVLSSFCPQEGLDSWTTQRLVQACYKRVGDDRWARKPPDECSQTDYSLHVCMKDNPSITPEEYERQKSLYKPWEVAYRVDGWPSNRAENAYFDMETLLDWEFHERTSPGIPYQVLEDTVNTDDGKFVGTMNPLTEQDVMPNAWHDEEIFPTWRVWGKPREGEKYVLSADCADGNPRSDFQSASVWRCTDQKRTKQVAHLHIRLLKPGLFAVQCACMAHCYGDCLLVPEANNDAGGTFTDRVRNYVNLYKRQTINQETEKKTTKLGWWTDRFTKGPLLETTYRALAVMAKQRIEIGRMENGEILYENWCPFKSRATLQEFMSFEEKLIERADGSKKIVWEAKRGSFDDCCMEACIAFRIIFHEYPLISSCKFPKVMRRSLPDEHDLGSQQRKEHRAFSKWKKRPSLKSLRKEHGGHANR